MYKLSDLIVFESDHYELLNVSRYRDIKFNDENYSMFMKFLMDLPYLPRFSDFHSEIFALHNREVVSELFSYIKPIYDKYRYPSTEDGYFQQGLDLTIGNPNGNFNLQFFYIVLWSNICYKIKYEIEVVSKNIPSNMADNPVRLTRWEYVQFPSDILGSSKVFTTQLTSLWRGSNLFRDGWDLPEFKKYTSEIGDFPKEYSVPVELITQYFDKILLRVGCMGITDVVDNVLERKTHRVSMSDCSDIFGFSFRESVGRIVRFNKRKVGDYMQYTLKDGIYMYRRMDIFLLALYLRGVITRNNCWVKYWSKLGL